jgi:hypothetical protein
MCRDFNLKMYTKVRGITRVELYFIRHIIIIMIIYMAIRKNIFALPMKLCSLN